MSFNIIKTGLELKKYCEGEALTSDKTVKIPQLPDTIIRKIQFFNPHKELGLTVNRWFAQQTLQIIKEIYSLEIKKIIKIFNEKHSVEFNQFQKNQFSKICKDSKKYFNLINFKEIKTLTNSLQYQVFNISEGLYNKSSIKIKNYATLFAPSFFVRKAGTNLYLLKKTFNIIINKDQLGYEEINRLMTIIKSMDIGTDRNTMLEETFNRLLDNQAFVKAIELIKLAPNNKSRYSRLIKAIELSKGFDGMLSIIEKVDNKNTTTNVKDEFISCLVKIYNQIEKIEKIKQKFANCSNVNEKLFNKKELEERMIKDRQEQEQEYRIDCLQRGIKFK